MTVGDGDQFQPKAPYPKGFLLAVKPEEVNANFCVHEATPPVCNCAHDWRIEWGNVKRKAASTSRSAVI
ncbi:hypothetical protein SEA_CHARGERPOWER_19 [Mycobacterium phage Chargerpower]|nr:hypothetical protein SEA_CHARGERPOWER_19 [Mycobacterium phage Chargerpower]